MPGHHQQSKPRVSSREASPTEGPTNPKRLFETTAFQISIDETSKAQHGLKARVSRWMTFDGLCKVVVVAIRFSKLAAYNKMHVSIQPRSEAVHRMHGGSRSDEYGTYDRVDRPALAHLCTACLVM